MNKYKNSGVDIKAGNDFIDDIKNINQKGNNIFKNNIGWFAGGFDISKLNIKEPVLFSSTDGVGSKLLLAIKNNKINNIGQDLVAMSVNDLICHGAKPLFFLDYIGTNKILKKDFIVIIQNIILCLQKFNCNLLGGETAELQDMYHPNEYDLCGMAVGIVSKKNIIDPKNIENDDIIIGINSNGFHSNGYSLIRKIIKKHNLDVNKIYFGKNKLIDELLKPTNIYVNLIINLMNEIKINGASHITGGGLNENIKRILPLDLKAEINVNKINIPLEFKFFQKLEKISNEEMFQIFNMGIGFCIIINKSYEKKALSIISKNKFDAKKIGSIKFGNKGVNFIWNE